MVRDNGPGKAVSFRIGDDNAKAFKEFNTVGVISENFLPLDAPDNDMVKSPRCIDSRFTWHVSFLSKRDTKYKKLII